MASEHEDPATDDGEFVQFVDDIPGDIPFKKILALGIGLAVLLVVIVLMVVGPATLRNSDTLRIEALKIVLTGVAAYAAAVTIWLSLRKQRHDEINSAYERATTLYSAACDQIASDKPAVRLAGLHSLDRLGQNHPDIRDTVIDVLCAYLRMGSRTERYPSSGSAEERIVRATAQRLIMAHLYPGMSNHWPGIDIDLTGAELEDFTATDAVFDGGAVFIGARFVGTGAWFRGVTFRGPWVYFDEAEFHAEQAEFANAVFAAGTVSFRDAFFRSPEVDFVGTVFAPHGDYSGVISHEVRTLSGDAPWGS